MQMQSLRAEEMRLITFLHFSHLAPESMHGQWALASPCAHLATFSLLASLQFWKIFSGIVGASGEGGVQFIRIEGYSFLPTHNW